MWYTHLFSNAMGGVFELFGMTRDYFLANRAGAFALKQLTHYLAEVRSGESVVVRSRGAGPADRPARGGRLGPAAQRRRGPGVRTPAAPTAAALSRGSRRGSRCRRC